jgi:hypothetical protein
MLINFTLKGKLTQSKLRQHGQILKMNEDRIPKIMDMKAKPRGRQGSR